MIRTKLLTLELEELNKLIETFNWEVIALDTETTSLDWYTQDIELVSMFDGINAVLVSKEVFNYMYPIIRDKIKSIIGHNLVFDMKALYKFGYNFFDKEWIDTMIMAHLIDEEGDKSLKQLAKNLLGHEVIDYVTAKKNLDTFYNYAINDSIYTYELANYFKPILIEQELINLFKLIEMPFLKVLARIEMNGVLIDIDRVNATSIELLELINELEINMLNMLNEKYDIQYDLFGNISVKSNINFNSTDDLADILFNRLKLTPIKTTTTGKSSTGKETISALKKLHPFVEELSKYKAAQKLYNSFFSTIKNYVDPDGRIRPHFNDTGTATGRLSCNNPNLQQLPRNNKELGIDTRSCFIASPGMSIIAIDYSQQELRIMAQLSKDEKLIKIINEGGDLHLINANNVFNLGIPEEKLYDTHPEYNAIKNQYKKERSWGKIFSFGVAYGMGPRKLSRDFNVSLSEAQEMLDRFFSGFPQLKKAIDQTHEFASNNFYVSTYLGRRRRFKKNQWGKLDGKALRQAFNFLIQSLGADIIRVACIKLQSYADANPHLGIRLLMTVHDEIVIECNSNYAKDVALTCEQILESSAEGFVCPLKAEAGIGLNYGQAK